MIGTTDAEHDDPSDAPEITPKERDYLLEFASQYFKKPVTTDDIVWTYSGVRPLYDDGASSASAATRDYVLSMDVTGGAPLLSVFGGKITTYRKLAESAMDKMANVFPGMSGEWTATASLPGGDFPVDGVARLTADLTADFAFLDRDWADRLVRTYGTQAREILGEAKSIDELGQDFGATVTGAEIDWVVENEWVRTTDDFLWRRTKLGLSFTAPQTSKLAEYLANGRNMPG